MATTTADPYTDLTEAEQSATATTATAQNLRDLVSAGDPNTTSADLAAAEADERAAALRLDTARQRAAEQRQVDDTARLERDRAAIQAEWQAAHARGADHEVQALMAAAADAALKYMRAFRARDNYLRELATRAQQLGFRVEHAIPPSPLPPLGRAIVEQARTVLNDFDVSPYKDPWSSR
jgi:hypothetical protein